MKKIQPSGVTALNKLRLSTQVPTKYTYLTSGSGRVLTLGNRTIELKRSVPKNFVFQTVLAALLVQALRTLGQKNVDVYKRQGKDSDVKAEHY